MIDSTTVETGNKKVVLDFTAVDTYLKCGMQFYFSRIAGIKAPPSVALLEGSSHHKAFRKNNVNKRDKGKDLGRAALTDEFVESFRKATSQEDLDWGDEDENDITKRAKTFHGEYLANVAPKMNPEWVEQPFLSDESMDGVDFKIGGIIDLTSSKSVYDYKVVGRAKSQSEADQSLQLSLYARATKLKKVAYVLLIKKAHPEIAIVESRRSQRQIDWAMVVASRVAKAVKAGVFPMARPDPSSWWCSEKFCGYWGRCRGKYS